MKKLLIAAMRKAGEKVAEVPINVRSWPGGAYQPPMPASLRQKMKDSDK